MVLRIESQSFPEIAEIMESKLKTFVHSIVINETFSQLKTTQQLISTT